MERLASADGREYTIHLHLPPGDAPATGFRVIWLLDSPTTWAPMQQAINEAGADDIAVIGVGWDSEGGVDQNLRRRDFTLPALHEVPPPHGSDEAWGEDGDVDAFLGFLTGTLQPHYLGNLPLDRARQTLVGHSLSGLCVLLALMRRPGAFQRLVAASPSVWWDQGRLLEDAERFDWSGAGTGGVLVTVGSGEQAAGPERPPEVAGEAAAAVLGERHMIANASTFAELLAARGIDCRFQLFEGEGHRTVLPAAMAAALSFARAN
jgi:uncharacterized protein